jgi:fused signal recognition particle receptor
MFSFFKRFKGSKESDTAADASQTAPEGSTPGLAAEAPIAPIAPTVPIAPAHIESPAAAAPSVVEPVPEFEFEETAPETVEIVPPPAQDASAKRSWLTRLKTGLSKTSSSCMKNSKPRC